MAPTNQSKFLVCRNLLGYKLISDSDSYNPDVCMVNIICNCRQHVINVALSRDAMIKAYFDVKPLILCICQESCPIHIFNQMLIRVWFIKITAAYVTFYVTNPNSSNQLIISNYRV